MKRFIVTLSLSLFLITQTALAQHVQTLAGLAVSVDSGRRELRVMFEHPVTGEDVVKIFQIVPSTNFKNVKKLEQIKPNDPVSIDYQETGNGKLDAVYIEVIPLKEMPFSRKDVLQSFRG